MISKIFCITEICVALDLILFICSLMYREFLVDILIIIVNKEQNTEQNKIEQERNLFLNKSHLKSYITHSN